jgi:hypothetical protein
LSLARCEPTRRTRRTQACTRRAESRGIPGFAGCDGCEPGVAQGGILAGHGRLLAARMRERARDLGIVLDEHLGLADSILADLSA